MKVLALMTDAFGAGGGIAEYNRNWAQALTAEPQLQLAILTRLPPDEAALPPPAVTQHFAGASKAIFAWTAFRRAIGTERPDCLFCGHINLYPLAALIHRLTGIPIWLQIHGIDAWSAPPRLNPASLRKATLISAVSDFTRRRFLEWAPVPPMRVEVIPNTFDEGMFFPNPPPADMVQRLDLAGRRVLLTVGRLNGAERYKGQDRIIDLLPRLIERDPRILYLIAGDGDDRPRLERRVAELGVCHHVRFLGQVSQATLPDLYRLADLFILAGIGEGFGIVLLEAMACGTPVVASCRDGSREAVQEGKLGAVVDPDDPDALLRAILQGLDAPRGVAPGLDDFRFPQFRRRISAALTLCKGG